MATWFLESPEEVWPQLDHTTALRVSRWIERAETIIETKFPTIQSRITAGELSARAVAGVVEEMVERAIRFDERGGIESEQMPEWSIGYEASQGLGKGSLLFLTTDEFALLAPPRKTGGIGSVRMARSYEVTDPTPETP